MKPVIVPKIQDNSKKSKTYLRYEKLLEEIEKKQQFRSNLQEGLEKTAAKINSELAPLLKKSQLLSRDYLIRLDELANEIGVGKVNREWFESYMADELDALLDFLGHQDKVLSNLYEKYAGLSADEIAEDDDLQEMVRSLSSAFGFEVDIKEFLEKGEMAYMADHQHEIEEKMREHTQTNGSVDDEPKSKGKTKKDNMSGETDQLAKDARSIYMRLVNKFHPDRETDPAAIEQKNEIIKQVTKAYQENDFFSLLKLQITHIDDNEKEAATVADDMIKRYNKILQKQLADLDRWVQEMHFASGAVISDFIDKNGKFSPQKFAARRKAIEKEQQSLSLALADSRKRPKSWFKDQIAMIKQMAQQNMMEDIFDHMFSDFKF